MIHLYIFEQLFSPKGYEYAIAVLAMFVLAYRWIVNRMAIMREHPDYESSH